MTSVADVGDALPPLFLTRSSLDGSVTASSIGAVQTTQTFDVSTTNPGYGDLLAVGVIGGGLSQYQAAYQHDDLGRITAITETLNGTARVRRYDYDDAGRLAVVRDEDDDVVASYAYDDNGNRTHKTGIGGTVTSACPSGQATNDVDQLCSVGPFTYTYDANGALLSKSSATGDTHYTYDGLGRLTKVILPDGRVIHYVHDAVGRRIGKIVDGQLVKGWLYADGLRPIAQLNAAGEIEATYVYASRANVPDLVIEKVGTSQVAYRLIADHLGTPRLLLQVSNGGVVHRLTLDEFGNVESESGSKQDLHPFGFAGGLRDRDTGLVRYGARDYDPETGRWTARDPILFAGGQANLYAYVGNDPVNYVDPSGRFAWIAAGAIAGAATDVYLQLQGNGGDWGKVDTGEVVAGAVVGAVLGSGVEFLFGTAFSATSTSGTLVAVTHWGPASPWVMVGGNNLRNWLMSGVLQLGYRMSSGVTEYVDKSQLRYPNGWEAVKGLLGQRICEK